VNTVERRIIITQLLEGIAAPERAFASCTPDEQAASSREGVALPGPGADPAAPSSPMLAAKPRPNCASDGRMRGGRASAFFEPLPFRGGVGVGPILIANGLGETETPHPHPSPEGEGLKSSAPSRLKIDAN